MRFRPRLAPSCLALLALLAALGCSGPSTRLTDVWANPEVQRPLQFKKVLAVVLVPNPEVRRVAEGKLTVMMKRTEGVPAWMAVTEETAKDRPKMEAMLKSEGFDGAVVMRLVSATQKIEWVPTSMGGFTGYWGHSYVATMTSGYIREERTVRVETRIFSLKDDRLVWAGYSNSFNLDDADQILVEVAAAVAADMKEKGLIQ